MLILRDLAPLRTLNNAKATRSPHLFTGSEMPFEQPESYFGHFCSAELIFPYGVHEHEVFHSKLAEIEGKILSS